MFLKLSICGKEVYPLNINIKAFCSNYCLGVIKMEKLKRLTEKIREVDQRDKEEQIKKQRMLSEAIGGLNVLDDIAKIPQITEYAKRRNIYIATGGFGSYNLLLHYGEKIPKGELHNVNTYYGLSLTNGTSDIELLSVNVVQNFIDDWFNSDSTSAERGVIKLLCEINEIKEEKMLERILDDLLK